MKLPARKTIVTSLIVAGVLGTLAWLALREPTQLASVAQVRYGPMEEQFSEEGKTRLKARYSVTAPVAGTLQRIGLQPGDAVKAGQTVAWIDPASPLAEANVEAVATWLAGEPVHGTFATAQKELPRIDEWVYDLALSADGKAAFTADWQGRLTAIDIESRKIVQQISPLLVSQ